MNQTESTHITEAEMLEFFDRLMQLLPFGTQAEVLQYDPFNPREVVVCLRSGSHVETYAIDITTRTFIRVYV